MWGFMCGYIWGYMGKNAWETKALPGLQKMLVYLARLIGCLLG